MEPLATAESHQTSATSACGDGFKLQHAAAAAALLAEYVARAPPDFVEPLLRPDRFHFGAVVAGREPIERLYHQARDSFWTEHEVDLSHDRDEWVKLSVGERFFLSRVLAFFAQSDGLVADNCVANFGEEITWREFKHVFNYQAMIEDVHSRTYSLLLNTFVRDDAERASLETSISTIPTIAAKAAFAQAYMHRDVPLAARLLAFVIVEGVFFSGAFCAIFYFKSRNKLHGVSFSNELIARDEGLHTLTSVLAYSYIQRRLPQAYVHALFADALRIEENFVRESIPVRLLGMSADTMVEYVQFVADRWLVSLGYDRLWPRATNPFPWMDLSALSGKTNFFERRVGEYALASGASGEASSASTRTTTAHAASTHTSTSSTLADAFAGHVEF
jgi:ribonucleoside-diphosphate reductase beta chain